MEIGMDNWTFGFTMIIVGMGGTLVVLSLFAVLMVLLKKDFSVQGRKSKVDCAMNGVPYR